MKYIEQSVWACLKQFQLNLRDNLPAVIAKTFFGSSVITCLNDFKL